MRVRFLAVPLWALLAVLVFALAGCQGGAPDAGRSPGPSPSGSPRPSPTPGGHLTATATPPLAPMDDLEQAVAARLGSQVANEGLHLEYVACPRWHGKAPRRLTCHGYLDGVRAAIHVHLSKLVGGAVSFKARLAQGLIATDKLQKQLRKDGFSQVDCGNAPAYPSVVGSRVVCAVHKDGQKRFVVATVTSQSGTVEIRGY